MRPQGAGLIAQVCHDLGDGHDRGVGTQDGIGRRCRLYLGKDRLFQRHLFRGSFKDKGGVLHRRRNTLHNRNARQDLRNLTRRNPHQAQAVSDTRRQASPRFGHRVGHAHRMTGARKGQGDTMPHQPRPDHRYLRLCHLIPPYSRHRHKECGPCRNLTRVRLKTTVAPPNPLARPSGP